VRTLSSDREAIRLNEALERLGLVVANQDKRALGDWVADDFALERDFGSIFSPGREPVENLAYAYGFATSSADRDSGWAQLARDLDGPFWYHGGLACGPPSHDSVVLPEDAAGRDVFSVGFVIGDVVVRERASHEAAPVAALTNPLLEVNWDPSKWVDCRGTVWIAVSDECMGRGFVPLDRLRTLLDRQVCLEFDGANWRIRKVVLGGD
jgi:hypothetical protein